MYKYRLNGIFDKLEYLIKLLEKFIQK